MPATACPVRWWKWSVLMAVMIGIDPHKGSHTAVAVGAAEQRLGKIRIRACPAQAGQLVAWAAAWPERTWAVEGAPGLGRLLGQQLVAAGGAGTGCAAQAGRPGAAAAYRQHRQKRSPTMPCPSLWRRCAPRRTGR